jgi:predicted O-methyltransferase YrrM
MAQPTSHLTGQIDRWRYRPERLRRKAVALTRHELSAELLEKFEELVYHPGISGNPDTHYQDHELRGAGCCTPSEAMLMYHAARLCSPASALEIGSYVGWSTAHIAHGLPRGGLTCVDPFTEVGTHADAGPALAKERFLQNMQRAAVAEKLRLVSECSPDIIPSIAPDGGWDFIFIDGWHFHGQPLRDVIGVLPHAAPMAVILLHDVWMVPVRDALLHLVARGWSFHVFDTSNYLTILWQAEPPAWLDELRQIGEGESFKLASAASRRFQFGLDDASLAAVRHARAEADA